MSIDRTKPSAVILDMLRTTKKGRGSVRFLIRAGSVFGFSANTVRVTLSRLIAQGLIDSPQRGIYQLSTGTDAISEFVEGWRLGEDRVRPWKEGCWVFAHQQGNLSRNEWALEALGFRQVRRDLYVRPDNLALRCSQLHALLGKLGLEQSVLLFTGTPDPKDTETWQSAWHTNQLSDEYEDALLRLRKSSAQLHKIPPDQARLTSFILGGEVIHRLAKDPLLPDQWIDVTQRTALWQAMINYDQIAKPIWAEIDANSVAHMPRPQLKSYPN